NERVRFRYLHMLPRQFNADGMVSGRLVHEGEVIGKVGNFFRRERATTYHLHFDMQVPTKYGWVLVNPYMTLVAGYERLSRDRVPLGPMVSKDKSGSREDQEFARELARFLDPAPRKQSPACLATWSPSSHATPVARSSPYLF